MSTVVRFTRAAAILLLLLAAPAVGQGQVVLGGYNTSGVPIDDYYYGEGMLSLGWYFTAPYDMLISGVQTRFGDLYDSGTSDRDVTVEVLTDRRAAGGTLLRETAFNSATAHDSYGGGSFTDLQLYEGDRIFIGLLDVGGLGVNMAEWGEAVDYWYDYDPGTPGQYASSSADFGGDPTMPIIRLMGDEEAPPDPSTVPEPATMLLLGTGLAGLAAARRRRHKS